MVKYVGYGSGYDTTDRNYVFQKFEEIKKGEGNTKWGKDVTKGNKGWDPKTGLMIEGPIGDPIPATVENAVREGMEWWLGYLEADYVTYNRSNSSTKKRLTGEQLYEAFLVHIFTPWARNNTDGNQNSKDLEQMNKWKEEGFDLEGFARSDEGAKMMMQAKIKANQDPWCKMKNKPCCSGPEPHQIHKFKTFGVTRTRPQCKGGRRKSRRKSHRKSRRRKSKKKKRRRKRKRTKKRRRRRR